VVKQSCAAISYLQELVSKKNEELPEIPFLDIRMPVKTGFDFW
jgi:hypothetical protein